MDSKTMYTLSYGLFVLSTRLDGKDNGCIINTACQVTGRPKQISITVDKTDFTEELLEKSGVFNISVLDESAPFSVFEHFGFQSGRDVDKTEGINLKRSENGIIYLPEYTCSYISCKVVQSIDLGTHRMFIAEVTDGEMLSDREPMTYAFYHKNVKPRPAAPAAPAAATGAKKGFWQCKICGYIYEGEELPEDFTCPICKHPASDFEWVEY